jgi:hypothetical protein
MDKVKKEIAAAYRSIQLAKLELDRLTVLNKPHTVPDDEQRFLIEIETIVSTIKKM